MNEKQPKDLFDFHLEKLNDFLHKNLDHITDNFIKKELEPLSIDLKPEKNYFKFEYTYKIKGRLNFNLFLIVSQTDTAGFRMLGTDVDDKGSVYHVWDKSLLRSLEDENIKSDLEILFSDLIKLVTKQFMIEKIERLKCNK